MQNAQKTHIVGIGASAGGLEALTQLVSHLRPDIPCAYVVLQHLSPTYRSMMVEILGRETSLAVREVAHGDVPQQGVIYVVPSNHNALIKEGRLQLVTAPPEVVPKPSANQFLISLAAEEGESAIGVILSGTGSDGVAGLRAIQAAGGFTLAQKPESAKYDGMPRAAIEAGVVDHILPPEEIALRLPELLTALPADAETPEDQPSDLLERLLALVREHLQFDFSGYKIGTLTRRIRRREIATGNRDLASYLAWVEANPNELEQLSRDILISVTAFFRDHEAFEVLRKAVRDLCLQKPPGSEFRVWVAGCASGEEAYSIAILFADALGSHLPQYRVQIFATDVDDEALTVARRGIYSAAALSEVPPDQLERHFSPSNHAYEVGKHLRDMIVFARHNLVSDPPFLRLDLVSCRNVLIYFDAPLQAKVLQTFNFGLAKDGYLFLGRSESVAQAEQLFTPLDRRERLFRKSGEPFTPPSYPTGGPLRSPGQRRERKFELLLAALVEHFGATAVLCSADGAIQHSVGHVEEFLEFPAGAAQLAIGEATTSLLRGELLSLLHHCRQTNQPQRGRRRKHGKSWVRMSVSPVADTYGQALLVLFTPESAPDAHDAPPAMAEAQQLDQSEIEDELVATREHLQTLVEEMATSNEEMQALNEEAQAANEELQATNEELEAANEELQATNEELVSLNGELSIKTAELVRLSEEYAHLYDALQFPILVFDRSGQLVRFNMPAQRRFDLRATAIRQHVSRLKLGMALNELERLLGHALAHADREEINVEQDGRTLRLGVTPGFTQAGDIITLVVTLIDVTDITQAYAQLAESQARLSALMANTQVLFCMKDLTGAYLFANQRYLDFFGLDANNYAGKTDFTLLAAPLAARLWELDMAALREQRVTTGEHEGEQRGMRYFLRSAHQMLADANGQPCALVTEAEDITRAHLAESQLRIAARLFDRSGEAILVTDAQGIIESANDACCQFSGYAISELVGKSAKLFKSDKHSDEFYQTLRHTLDETGVWQGAFWGQAKQGEARRQWLTLSRIDNEAGQCEHYVAVLADGAHIRDAQLREQYLASHDSLTGLLNHAQFQDQLRHVLAQARRAKTRVSLLHIELDNAPALLATFGAEASLALFRQAALRLRELLPDGGQLARLGDTSMLALLGAQSADQVQQLANSMVDELAASFTLGEQVLTTTASIGIACYPEDGGDSASLATAAEAAMRHAHTLGRNQTAFFQPELQVRLHKHAALNSALREGLRQQRLRLVFQPKFQLDKTRALVGAEALLCWRDPVLGEVPPAEFIPVAESSGLIHALHQYELRLLCAQLRQWQAQELRLPPITLNVSAVCLSDARFAANLLAYLDEQALSPKLLHIEISESALHAHFDEVASNLTQLAHAGVRASVDDFGSGHSSLGHLRRLPLTRLKIDDTLIDGLGRNPEDETMVSAVLAMARALKLQTVAEGVSTQAQLDWLATSGCDMAQGFLLAPPQEPDAFAARLCATPPKHTEPLY